MDTVLNRQNTVRAPKVELDEVGKLYRIVMDDVMVHLQPSFDVKTLDVVEDYWEEELGRIGTVPNFDSSIDEQNTANIAQPNGVLACNHSGIPYMKLTSDMQQSTHKTAKLGLFGMGPFAKILARRLQHDSLHNIASEGEIQACEDKEVILSRFNNNQCETNSDTSDVTTKPYKSEIQDATIPQHSATIKADAKSLGNISRITLEETQGSLNPGHNVDNSGKTGSKVAANVGAPATPPSQHSQVAPRSAHHTADYDSDIEDHVNSKPRTNIESLSNKLIDRSQTTLERRSIPNRDKDNQFTQVALGGTQKAADYDSDVEDHVHNDPSSNVENLADDDESVQLEDDCFDNLMTTTWRDSENMMLGKVSASSMAAVKK